MKLYHYVHCPFCLRVRMVLGLLNIPYQSVVVPYNDEKTPISLIGKKMLPIMAFDNETIVNESLDIIKKLDQFNSLSFEHLNMHRAEIDNLLNKIGENVHSLCMPYWIYSPEFNEESRAYFQKKKEEKRGPFKELIKSKHLFIKNLDLILSDLESKLNPFYMSNKLTVVDIMIASHLWGMFIFPEFQFKENIYQYLMTIKKLSHFDYHTDFWK